MKKNYGITASESKEEQSNKCKTEIDVDVIVFESWKNKPEQKPGEIIVGNR